MRLLTGKMVAASATCFILVLFSGACASSPPTPPATPVPGASTASVPAPSTNRPAYFEFQIEKPVERRPETGYPKHPVSEADTARVLAQFVVDSTGVPLLSTFHVLRMTSRAAALAVYEALKTMRYSPAEIGGRRVNQLVQEKFSF
jgi:hypothetical protein